MKRRDEILVGLFTTAAVIILVVGTIWLLRGGLEKGYALYGRFPWGSGLKEGQPVWLSGVTVGFVDDVDLRNDGQLIVTFRILDKYKVPKGSIASIVPNGFFGDVAVALQPERPNPVAYEEGDTVPAKPGAAGLSILASRADSALQVTQRILSSTQQQLVDSGGLREIRLMLAELSHAAATLSRAVDTQSKQLDLTLGTVRSRASAIDSASVDSTVRAIHAATENFVSVTDDLKLTTTKLNALIAKADSGDGNMARLLSDSTLYQNLLASTARFDSLLADIKKNPRKYINLSIFGRR